jgi:hypothetical protein
MTPQMMMGVLAAACIGSLYLMIVRKLTIGKFLLGLGLCGAVLLVATQWESLAQLSHGAVAPHSAAQNAAPAVHTTMKAVIKAAHPSPVSHHTVVTQTVAPVVHPTALSMRQLALPSCIGSVLGVLLVAFIAIKKSTRARPAYQPARPADTRCPECQQEGDLQIYLYKKGAEQFVGALCSGCAERYKATSPREPIQW